MTSRKQKFYVVWYGHKPGVYASWDECRQQTVGFKGAKYKAYPTAAEASQAFIAGPEDEHPASAAENIATTRTKASPAVVAAAPELPPEVNRNAIAVDAACAGNPGKMEYRGIYLKTGKQLFHFGPCFGTNNIGEFLAIVHALALIKQCGANVSVYSDSRNAILWVKQKKCKTTLPRNARTEELFRIIGRAEAWLAENGCTVPLIKWETSRWGEIPADFGRKK